MKRIFHRNILAVLLALSVVALMLPGCTPKSAASKITRGFSITYEAKTIEQLCSECVTVVRGKVTKKGPSTDVGETVHTTVQVEVQELFKGDAKNAKSTLYWELGGETATQIVTPDSGSLIPVGQEAFFFIHEDGSCYPGYYVKDGAVALQQFMKPDYFTSSDGNSKNMSVEALSALIRDDVK